mgnify:CR=1 FL=1
MGSCGEHSVVISDHGAGKVARMSLKNGSLLWSSDRVTNPGGIVQHPAGIFLLRAARLSKQKSLYWMKRMVGHDYHKRSTQSSNLVKWCMGFPTYMSFKLLGLLFSFLSITSRKDIDYHGILQPADICPCIYINVTYNVWGWFWLDVTVALQLPNCLNNKIWVAKTLPSWKHCHLHHQNQIIQ